MSLRDWSSLRVLGIVLGWVILVLVIGLPRVLSMFTGRGTGGQGRMVAMHFGPEAMLLVLLVAVVPPLVLYAIWLWQRAH
jgi:hypothetical protein